MKFYSVVLRKNINIPDNKVRNVNRKGRRFAVGKYMAKCKATGKPKEYEAWRVLGMANKKK